MAMELKGFLPTNAVKLIKNHLSYTTEMRFTVAKEFKGIDGAVFTELLNAPTWFSSRLELVLRKDIKLEDVCV